MPVIEDFTRESFLALIPQVGWFSQIGKHPASSGVIVLRSIEPEENQEKWDWLPTIGYEEDTKYAPLLIALTRECGCEAEAKQFSMACYKSVLQSLRPIPDRVPLLAIGPHNLTSAAKGAAKFAFRMAAMEIVVARKGLWSTLILLYANGYWPCGITDNGKNVVY